MQALGEVADEADHGRMPEVVEAKLHHFGEGLFGSPIFKGDAVDSDHNAGAILAELAMDENGLGRSIAKDSEEMKQVGIAGSGEAADGNALKFHSESFDEFAFLVGGVWRFGAKIDDGGHTEFLELRNFSQAGLGTAKKAIVDSSGVMNARNGDFCSRRWNTQVAERRRARSEGKREGEKKEKEAEEWRRSHRELREKSLEEKKEEEKEGEGEEK